VIGCTASHGPALSVWLCGGGKPHQDRSSSGEGLGYEGNVGKCKLVNNDEAVINLKRRANPHVERCSDQPAASSCTTTQP
jgi:hypothetical protein